MISEKDVAGGFPSFWEQLFPFLTADFVRVFNATRATAMRDSVGRAIVSLPTREEVRHHDIVAEVAFHMAQEAHRAQVAISGVVADQNSRRRAVERVRDTLLRVHEERQEDFILTSDEWEEVARLLERYASFLDRELQAAASVEFEPVFPGLGFVDACKGDLSVGNVLYEIKTVARSLQSRDLRQLFLYLTLQAATGDRRWDRAGFVNPRRGLVYRFSVEELCDEISGGKAGIDVFGEIADFLCSRDIDLDRSF